MLFAAKETLEWAALDIIFLFIYNRYRNKITMKKIWLSLLFLMSCLDLTTAANLPDFTVSDIVTKEDNFIYIKLQNLSIHDFQVPPEHQEKIFLTIFINNVKRSEYKLKYIDKKLFLKKSTILFRTNFRMQKGLDLKVKVQLNQLKIIPESNFLNNTLEKRLRFNEKQ
jgi:hypothetical protein